MKTKTLLVIAILVMLFTSCTDNVRAKHFGGTSTINLPPGIKLVMVTWKGDELWYSTRPFRHDEEPETTTFQERSSFGLVEGKVIFVESAKPD